MAAPSGAKVIANRQAIVRKLLLRAAHFRLAHAHPATESSGNNPTTNAKKISRIAGREMRPHVTPAKLKAFSTGRVIAARLTNAPKTSTRTMAAQSVLSANLPIDELA